MKRPFLILSFLVPITAATFVWCLFEIGTFESNLVHAADEKEKVTTEVLPIAGAKAEENVVPQDHAIIFKEQQLKERETIMKEQLVRTDKLITELRDKLKRLELESKAKLNEKDSEMKKILVSKESEAKRSLASKEAEINRLKKELKGVKDDRVQNYKTIYEKMESKKAARILDSLDIKVASEILADMKQEKAADILGKMEPERARQLTLHPFGKKPVPKETDEESPLKDLSKGQ